MRTSGSRLQKNGAPAHVLGHVNEPIRHYVANLPLPIGRRPVLLLTRTSANESVVNLDNIHVIPKASLDLRIGSIPPARQREIKRALGYVLDWAELKVL